MRGDFKIYTWSYFSVEKYIKIIKQKSDLYKLASFLTYQINSFFTFKSSELILAKLICFPTSVQNYFGRCMTRPYARAFRQTNFSEGGFANRVPFLFFFFFPLFLFFLSFSLDFSNVFDPFQVFPWPVGGFNLITQGRWVVNFRLIICQK